MFDGQNLVVDQLVKIIEAIQIGRTTGSLVATRGEGPSYEVGTLVFVKGRIVQAKVGRREDRDALNWLSTWGRCRYTFVLSGVEGVLQEDVVDKATGVMQRVGEQKQDAKMNGAVPYRSQPLAYGLQVMQEKRVSRVHRHVFLLVDGVRQVGDFMRLLKLDEYEVLALLYDLADLGIIHIPTPLSY
jgi:hypothetical protein